MTDRYTVMPLDPNNLDWLRERGIAIPPLHQQSRFPTLDELRQTLARLPDCSIDFDQVSEEEPWPITIRRDTATGEEQTVIKVTPFQGDDVPHGLWFEQALPPLVITLLKSLAAFTGPLAVLAISDGTATVVDQGSDVPTVLDSWKHSASN